MSVRDVLDDLLNGGTLSEPQLDDLLRSDSTEGLWHDFKSGKLMDDPDRAETIRRWVTGFANSDGGMVIVGVDETKPVREVDGATARGRETLNDWAGQVLKQFAPYFSPPVHVSTVKHSRGEVLVIAVARAPQLIAYKSTEGAPIFALRMVASTLDAPGWLITDLVLGRRNHPILDLRNVHLNQPTVRDPDGNYQVSAVLEVVNHSLVTARDTRIGIVAWSLNDGPSALFDHLKQYLDAKTPPYYFQLAKKYKWALRDTGPEGDATIRPFELVAPRVDTFALIPSDMSSGMLSFAIYFLPDGSPPVWYEVKWRYGEEVRLDQKHYLVGKPTVQRMFNTRPVVEWYL
jgi:hypothetical protein